MVAQFPEALQAKLVIPIGLHPAPSSKPCRAILTEHARPFVRARNAPRAVVEKPLCTSHLSAVAFPAGAFT